MANWWLLVVFALLSTGAYAQWLNYPTPGTPRTHDGKPNLAAPAPRSSDGKPDLSGVWQTELVPPGQSVLGEESFYVVPGDDPRTFNRYFWNILADFKPGEAPIRPEAAELFRKNAANAITPVNSCLPLGIPAADMLAYAPFKVIQTHGVTVVFYEVDNTHRQIYTDGRKLPADPNPSWLGYSVGHWEGDTFVVDSAGFNDKGRLDGFGHPRSEALRVQERFHRRDFGHMDLQMTIEDPKMYLMPITVKVTELLVPDSDVLESFCNENEKDRAHLQKQ
jgi:hypothetical protein